MSQFSDETLMAFADGKLDNAEFDAVAEAVESDPAVAARLQKLVEGASLAKQGFSVLLQPVPAALEASVRAAISKTAAVPWWQRLARGFNLSLTAGAAVAAGVAVLALPLGYSLGRLSDANAWSALPDPALGAALDTLASGEARSLAGGLTVLPVATFLNSAGKVCREYETSGDTSTISIACRSGGVWQTQLIVATGTEQGYRTASGMAVVDAFLDSIGAGPVLLDTEEAEILARPTDTTD